MREGARGTGPRVPAAGHRAALQPRHPLTGRAGAGCGDVGGAELAGGAVGVAEGLGEHDQEGVAASGESGRPAAGGTRRDYQPWVSPPRRSGRVDVGAGGGGTGFVLLAGARADGRGSRSAAAGRLDKPRPPSARRGPRRRPRSAVTVRSGFRLHPAANVVGVPRPAPGGISVIGAREPAGRREQPQPPPGQPGQLRRPGHVHPIHIAHHRRPPPGAGCAAGDAGDADLRLIKIQQRTSGGCWRTLAGLAVAGASRGAWNGRSRIGPPRAGTRRQSGRLRADQ